MANPIDTQNQAGGQTRAPSPSEGGSQHQGGIPSPGGNVKTPRDDEYVEDRAELESDPSPDEDDVGQDDSGDAGQRRPKPTTLDR